MDDTDKTIRPNSLDLTDDEAQLLMKALGILSRVQSFWAGTEAEREAAEALEARIREECGL